MEKKTLDQEWFNYPGVKENYRTMVYYPGDGGDTFEFNFVGGFINPADIKAFMIDDVNRDVVNLTVKVVGQNTAKLNRVVPVGWTVCIFRDTPKDRPLSVFQDGASITAKSLDRNAQQAIFAVSEMVDRFDSTVSQVETALKEVKKANDNAAEALAESKKATGIALAAQQDSAAALVTSKAALDTADGARRRAEQAVQTAEDAKATAEGLDSQIKSANATAADAKRIAEDAKNTANGIDGKATQAQKDAAAAVKTANEAKQIANGIDAKATQAQKDAADALKKANDVEASVGTVQELSKRVKEFKENDAVEWKGMHTFNTRVVAKRSTTEYGYMDVQPSYTSINHGANGDIGEFRVGRSVFQYQGRNVHYQGYASPVYATEVKVTAPSHPRISVEDTDRGYLTSLIQNTDGQPLLEWKERGTIKGQLYIPTGTGTVATREWTNKYVSTSSGGGTQVTPVNGGPAVIAVNPNGNTGFWDNTTSRWTFRVNANGDTDLSTNGITVRPPSDVGTSSKIEIISPDTSKRVGLWAYNDGRTILAAYAGGAWSNITIGGIGNGVMATREWVNSQGFQKGSGSVGRYRVIGASNCVESNSWGGSFGGRFNVDISNKTFLYTSGNATYLSMGVCCGFVQLIKVGDTRGSNTRLTVDGSWLKANDSTWRPAVGSDRVEIIEFY